MSASSVAASELRLRDACLAHADPSLDCTPPATSPDSDPSCTQQHSDPNGAIDEYAREFACNVCAQECCDPVVTMCGHLFCWPCLYRWLSTLHPTSHECPVCRADVRDKIVPLYGCGRLSSSTEKIQDIHIPSRPLAVAHSDNHRSKPNSAIQQNGARTGSSAHLAFCALLRRFGLTSLAPQEGGFLGRYVQGVASRLMHRRRFNNEKEFALHWLFIIAASATIPFLVLC